MRCSAAAPFRCLRRAFGRVRGDDVSILWPVRQGKLRESEAAGEQRHNENNSDREAFHVGCSFVSHTVMARYHTDHLGMVHYCSQSTEVN